ncbi:MAG: hypothetical protein RL758_1336, partial [Pseudomonadota bacterium]
AVFRTAHDHQPSDAARLSERGSAKQGRGCAK